MDSRQISGKHGVLSGFIKTVGWGLFLGWAANKAYKHFTRKSPGNNVNYHDPIFKKLQCKHVPFKMISLFHRGVTVL
jgi:hypothetical protein